MTMHLSKVHHVTTITRVAEDLGEDEDWLRDVANEMEIEDGDTLFGLADLGFGCPELGSFSLAEIAAVRLRFGLRVERDQYFSTAHRLSEWAAAARQAGSIIGAASHLRRAAMARTNGLSDPSGD